MSKLLSVGYQLYSAREDMARDMEDTLSQLAGMGYQGVEFAGFFERSAKEIAKLLKKTGLEPIGSHVSLQQIRENMCGVLDFHEDIGCRYIVVPSLPEDCRPGARGFAGVLQTLYTFGKMCKKRDMTLLYHNHDFEFTELSGQCGLDFLFEAIPADLLQTELDVCWVRYAGLDPAAYLRRYARRCPLVHIHDYVGTRGDRPSYALVGLETVAPDTENTVPLTFKPVGSGCQDIPALIDAAEESHVKWLVVEQDESPERPALEAAEMSAAYLLGFEKMKRTQSTDLRAKVKMRLTTERLLLIPYQPSYANDVYREFTEEIVKYQYPDAFDRIESAEALLSNFHSLMEQGQMIQLVILSKDGEFLGMIEAHGLQTQHPEIGIWLKASAHGLGYGFEALKRLMEHLNATGHYQSYLYEVDERNASSLRLLEKFQHEKTGCEEVVTESGKKLILLQYLINLKA